tara:strand:+ start:1305 stop:1736 length:432 start_codon:yes stop_codon:yes gene_type:complete
MARRKNTKRIDPRYFLNETTYRDEIEETQQSVLNEEATTISVSDLTALSYNKLKDQTGGHPVFKVPDENLYYQLRDLILYNNETGQNEPYGIALDYATTPRMKGSMEASLDKRKEEDQRDLTDVARWMSGILSKKHDQLQLVQ